jgi:hypothetical protein
MAFRTSGILMGAALLATPAFAQDATQTAPSTQPAAPAAAPAAPAGAATVSDAEVKQFASAALAVEKVRKDAAVPEGDKNGKMVEAIGASGLPPARFNEIAEAMQADPALNKRIQEAAAAQQPAR